MGARGMSLLKSRGFIGTVSGVQHPASMDLIEKVGGVQHLVSPDRMGVEHRSSLVRASMDLIGKVGGVLHRASPDWMGVEHRSSLDSIGGIKGGEPHRSSISFAWPSHSVEVLGLTSCPASSTSILMSTP